jgi:ankyrin repeat protein
MSLYDAVMKNDIVEVIDLLDHEEYSQELLDDCIFNSVELGEIQITRLLLENGASPNTANHVVSVLRMAIEIKCYEIVKMLLEKGAVDTMEDDETSIMCASRQSRMGDIVWLLLEHGFTSDGASTEDDNIVKIIDRYIDNESDDEEGDPEDV